MRDWITLRAPCHLPMIAACNFWNVWRGLFTSPNTCLLLLPTAAPERIADPECPVRLPVLVGSAADARFRGQLPAGSGRSSKAIMYSERSQTAKPRREIGELEIQIGVLVKIEGMSLVSAASMRYSILTGAITSQTLKSAAFSSRILSMNALKDVPVKMLTLGRSIGGMSASKRTVCMMSGLAGGSP